MEKKKKTKMDQIQQFKLDLQGATEREKTPDISVYAVDRSLKPIQACQVDEKGTFKLSDSSIEKAHRIIIGPTTKDLTKVERTRLSIYRPFRFREMLLEEAVISIPRSDWIRWFFLRYCVNGSVRKCYFFPWYASQLLEKFDPPHVPGQAIQLAKVAKPFQRKIDIDLAKPQIPVQPYHRCVKICDGLVEVYRRICCCRPWIIWDPRLPDLVRGLEDLLPDPPIIKWPPEPWPPLPEPGPDPSPLQLQKLSFLKNGTLDERVLNAPQDVKALKTMPPEQIPSYVNARPYLRCHCGQPKKVAQGFIRPDGDFHICWYQWPLLIMPHCHVEYAYVVKQHFNGNTIVIYDGLAANQWFKAGEHADLVTYHPLAQACRRNDPPVEADGAFAMLQQIGQTSSYHLKTPDAADWDRVNSPVWNDGLAYPAASPAQAVGKYLDRNWGGTLQLMFYFSENLKAVGAKYYRVSIAAADANGNPTGIRTYLEPRNWKYFVEIGSDIHIINYSLGPTTTGTEGDLYEIPYDTDRTWLSGQFHAILDTRLFANGRHLLTLEIFNNAGKLIRPVGTPGPSGSVTGDFTYRRWYQETGPTANVPFAGLTHMLWWDNTKIVADILDLRLNGYENTSECQFLEGPGNSTFSIGYRVYHPNSMFVKDHRIWWRRGLGGASGLLHPISNPVTGERLSFIPGMPASDPAESATNTFSEMLDGHDRCTFTVNLHANVKTFNGYGTLDGLDGWDQASFALEIPSP